MAQIHLVDDDPSFLDLVRMVLEVAGHETLSFQRATESLEALSDNPPDAVVLDLMLEDMDGFEYLAAIRQSPECARTPVLVCSALEEARFRTRAFKLGADDFVIKPIEPEELLARVERLLERTAAASLEGTLEGYSMMELLQSLDQAKRTCLVRWTGEEGHGWIALLEGVVVAARSGRLSGLEAALSLLDLKTARFALEPEAKLPEAGARRFPVTDLLMQKSWLEDEIRRRLGPLRAATRGLEAVAPGSDVDSRIEKRILDRVTALPGVTLLELLDHQIASPQRTRYAIAMLMERSSLRARVDDGPALHGGGGEKP